MIMNPIPSHGDIVGQILSVFDPDAPPANDDSRRAGS
jgi:hypothetical protein